MAVAWSDARVLDAAPMNKAHDDEGVIDLRALSVPPRHGASSASAGFSFASELPPPGELARGATATARWSAQHKTLGLAAAAVAFVVLSGVGVAFAFRGEQAVRPPIVLTNTLVAPRAAAPAAAPAPAPPADPAASAAASTDDDDSSETPKRKKQRARARSGKGASHAGQTRSAPAAVKHSKPADPCHCRGDFQCNIRCAANFKH